MLRKRTPLSAATDRVFPKVTLGIAEKHSAVVRWTHWINFPLLTIMIWSGLLIYWAGSSTDHSIPHQVYRVGIGSFTLFRLFPDGFYEFFHLDGHLTRGLAFHALFMWAFAANGVLYFLFLIGSGQWRNLAPNRESMKQFMTEQATNLRRILKRVPLSPPTTSTDVTISKYNPVQRIAYTCINFMALGSILTGIAIWKPTSLHIITALCGGYQNARWLHFWLTMGFCAFFFIHLVQVARAGWNNLRSMIIGQHVVSLSPKRKPRLVARPVLHLRPEATTLSGGASRD